MRQIRLAGALVSGLSEHPLQWAVMANGISKDIFREKFGIK